jgi:uncharacterized protein with FMN-binding domain
MSVEEDVKGKGKPKRKSKLRGCAMAVGVLVVVLLVSFGIFWIVSARERQEAASLPLNAINFNKLSDGTYHGAYAGGMYGWRVNECDVRVANGKVAEIQLADSKDKGSGTFDYQMLYDEVVQAQSLQVDTVSGATLTTKAYLQCVENALLPAQHE